MYLDLRRIGRNANRPTDEIIRLYALECLVSRIALSSHAARLVLKGGVLLAAFGVRRPTRDVDLAALHLTNDVARVLAIVQEVAAIPMEDGVAFDAATATAGTIREEARGAVRVELTGRLATARIALNVDVNMGDPIVPEARLTPLPRLLGGSILANCYPLTMVLAEKLVTAMERGTLSTRWRDYVDIAALARTQRIASSDLLESMRAVSEHRGIPLQPLRSRLAGFAERAQPRWLTWRKKQLLEAATPIAFEDLLDEVIRFADPLVLEQRRGLTWDAQVREWISTPAG